VNEQSRRAKDRRVNTPLVEEAKSAKDTVEAKVLNDKPITSWIDAISQSDEGMSRGQEDLITHLIDDHGYGELIHPVLKARYLAKRAIRARYPM